MTNSDINDETAADSAESASEAPATAAEADDTARLEAENAELKDRALRTLAEMQNLRKRTEREVQDARAYAVTAFARDVLSVADNLGRALTAVPEGEDNAALKGLIEGVSLTSRELESALAKHGVTKIEPQAGDKFDPNLHQAMFEVPDPSQPSGVVVQVVQSGFALSGRLLRPALVGVSKGGPKAEAVDRKV